MGPMSSMPATAAQWQKQNEQLLAAAREAFPGWDFHPVFGGWEAVPEGTPVVRSMDLGSLMEKLAEHEGRQAPEIREG
jgi:hypothetical protein